MNARSFRQLCNEALPKACKAMTTYFPDRSPEVASDKKKLDTAATFGFTHLLIEASYQSCNYFSLTVQVYVYREGGFDIPNKVVMPRVSRIVAFHLGLNGLPKCLAAADLDVIEVDSPKLFVVQQSVPLADILNRKQIHIVTSQDGKRKIRFT